MEQLSGLDAAFVHQESRRTPMHVSVVLIYDIGNQGKHAISSDAVCELLANRLGDTQVFHRELHQVPMGMDAPYWVDVADPDWRAHITETTLPAGTDWQGFQRHLAHLHNTQLNLERPLWEIELIHGLSGLPGLPANCQALVLKLHHAAIDGMSMAAIIDSLHNDRAGRTDSPRQRLTRPSDWDLWSRANRNFAGRQIKLVETLRKLLPGLAKAREAQKDFADLPPISRAAARFNKRVSGTRTTGAVLLPRDQVIAIKRAVRRVTLNDIALACVGGALRKYLVAHGRMSKESLVCGAPISLRGVKDKAAGGNKIATMAVGLATHVADPVERLRLVHRYAVAGKKQINALGTGTVMDISDSLTPGLLAEGIKAMARVSQYADVPVPFHTMVSNVPGPQQPKYLGRAELVVPLGLGPIRDNLGLFHIVSGGQDLLSISFSACAKLLPDASFYEECLQQAFDELCDSAENAVGVNT